MADTADNKQDTPEGAPKGSTPPWGDDFDAERAWTLVQNLRAEKETLKAEVASEKQKSQALEASQSDGQKELQARAEAAEERAKKAEHKLTLSNVLRDFPDLADFEDLLTGETEEELRAKAERLASIGGKKAGTEEPQGDPAPDAQADAGADLGQKPEPVLTPGHGGEEKAPFDPAAIAQAARDAGRF